MRQLKDGWPILKEWVSTFDNKGKEIDRRVHWVETKCPGCGHYTVAMPLSKLVARGPDLCDGCEAYQEHLW